MKLIQFLTRKVQMMFYEIFSVRVKQQKNDGKETIQSVDIRYLTVHDSNLNTKLF